MKHKYYKLVVLIIISMLFTSCKAIIEEDTTYERTVFVLGTIVTVQIFDHGSEEQLDNIFQLLSTIESNMSKNIETSEVSDINNNAGIKKVKVSDDTYNVIKKSLEYSEISNGKFDISLGPIIDLWKIGTEEAKVPKTDEISERLKLVDYKNIELLDDNYVYLKNRGMIIDLGGIAKGYAADLISDILIKDNVEKAIINLGGNIFALGEKENSQPWIVGIQDPFQQRGTYVGTVKVKNKTVVTSGLYERYFIEEGIRYHHIFDKDTGYPVDNNIESVTIVSEKSIDADALSTISFTLGVEEGLELINSTDGVDCMFITKEKEIFLSNGLKQIFDLHDQNFVIIGN